MFLSPLKVMLLDGRANEGRGHWRLLEPLLYETNDGHLYGVPADFETDFASRADVLHDYLCKLFREHDRPRKLADDIFHEAMLSTGIPRSHSESLDMKGQNHA